MRASLACWMALAVGFGGCKRDEDAQKLVTELGSLGDAVEAVVHEAPDETGVAKAEALVSAKRADLHARVLAMNDADLSPDVSMALGTACVKIVQTAKIARGYVDNAVLKTNPPLRARGNALGLALCEICETGTPSRCSAFRGEH